jgi:hypothetical protein
VAIPFLVPLPSAAASDRSKSYRPTPHKWVPGLYNLEDLHICLNFKASFCSVDIKFSLINLRFSRLCLRVTFNLIYSLVINEAFSSKD